MRRISEQPWRLAVPVAIVVVSLALSACGGGSPPQPLPSQPPVGAKAPGATQPAAAPATTKAPAAAAPTQPGAAPAATQPAAPGKAAGDPAAGQQAVARYGCGGCHTIPGVQGAAGTVGPSLAGFAAKSVIAGTSVANNPENLTRWVMNPPAVKPGTTMPNLNVNQTDAQNISAFLLTLR